MASITREIHIDADPAAVWDALRDFDAVHERLVPGFVVDCRVEAGGDRVVTFFTGTVARERLVTADDAGRRLVYTVVESAMGATHHNAAAQVVADGPGGTRFTWTTDVLPDALAGPIGDLMDRGIAVIEETLTGR